jgi:hypothetical protein
MSRRRFSHFYVGIFAASRVLCLSAVHSGEFFKRDVSEKRPATRKELACDLARQRILGYAVNFEGGSYFANPDGLLVHFDGWQVVGLNLPGLGVNKVSEISYENKAGGGRVLTYKDGRSRTLTSDRCEPWAKTAESGPPSQARRMGWFQRCQAEHGFYHNEMELNDAGQLVRLVFTVKPKTSPTIVEYIH